MTDQDDQGAPGVLDTSVVISLPDLTDAGLLPEDPKVTVITMAELTVGPKVAKNEKVRKERATHLEEVEAAFDAPLPFDAGSVHAFGHVAASLRRRGAKKRARSMDALIAATAVAHQMPLYTSNPRDFEEIEDLEVFEVPEPTRPAG